MGRRQGRGHLGDDLEPFFERDLGEAALLPGPLREIAALGELRFDEPGWRVEAPIEDPGDVVAVPELLLE